MIEKYENIAFFTPEIFKDNIIEDGIDAIIQELQNFVNFICKEYNIKNKPIDFENIKFDSGTFSSDKNKINLNELYHVNIKIKQEDFAFSIASRG